MTLESNVRLAIIFLVLLAFYFVIGFRAVYGTRWYPIPIQTRRRSAVSVRSREIVIDPDNKGMQREKSIEDIKKYASCMERVRHHLRTVEGLLAGRITTGHQDLTAELIFLHFRKALEEMAFSSLCANVDKYSAVREKFASFWRAKDLLKEIGEINPAFFPVPVTPPASIRAGAADTTYVNAGEEGCLTREDFDYLYTQSSKVLHARNPYRTDDPTIDVKHTVPVWVSRFQKLLKVHYIRLVDHDEIWMVTIPVDGPVQVGVARLIEPSPGPG
jgi:hypothetical protein